MLDVPRTTCCRCFVKLNARTRLASAAVGDRIYDVHEWASGEGVVLAALDPDRGDEPLWVKTLPFEGHFAPLRVEVEGHERGVLVTVDADHVKGGEVRVFTWTVSPAGDIVE